LGIEDLVVVERCRLSAAYLARAHRSLWFQKVSIGVFGLRKGEKYKKFSNDIALTIQKLDAIEKTVLETSSGLVKIRDCCHLGNPQYHDSFPRESWR
jgi:hypothetical protein